MSEASQAELIREMEKLRSTLYKLVGETYDRKRIQKAHQLSSRLDEVIVDLLKLQYG